MSAGGTRCNVQVLATVRDTWRLVFGDGDRFVLLVGPPLVLVLIFQAIDLRMGDGNGPARLVTSYFGGAAIAGAWHRLAVLGRLPKWHAAVSDLHLYYYVTVLFLAFVAMAPFLVVTSILPGPDQRAVSQVLLGIQMLLPVVFVLGGIVLVLARFALALPAVAALNPPAMWLAQAWAATRGQGWRCLAVQLLVVAPVVLAAQLPGFAPASLRLSPGLGWLAATVFWVLGISLYAAALGLLFHRLAPEPGAASAPPATGPAS